MQNHVQQMITQQTREQRLQNEALGITSPFAFNRELTISKKQIEILEDAIARYERLEDIKKFSALVLEDVENITEDDIKRALNAEKGVSIDDDEAVLALLHNEGFLEDLDLSDFDL